MPLSQIAAIAACFLFIIAILAVYFRKAVGRASIVVAEVSILVANVIFVTVCGLAGGISATQNARIYGLSSESAGVIGFVLAAVLAFLFASLISAMFFLLIQIEANTRKVAGYFDRMTRAQAGNS